MGTGKRGVFFSVSFSVSWRGRTTDKVQFKRRWSSHSPEMLKIFFFSCKSFTAELDRLTLFLFCHLLLCLSPSCCLSKQTHKDFSFFSWLTASPSVLFLFVAAGFFFFSWNFKLFVVAKFWAEPSQSCIRASWRKMIGVWFIPSCRLCRR